MILLVSLASATTLDEVVRRATEVSPSAVVAQLEADRQRMASLEAWTALGPTVSASIMKSRTIRTDPAPVDTLSVSLGLLTPGLYFDAAQASAEARGAVYVADATTLDAQYAAASLYYEALSAQSALVAAKQGAELAAATVTATRARVAAGLESELLGRSAEIGKLQADAALASAEAALTISRARLARAILQDVGELAPAALPELPTDAGESPWLRAADASVDAARWDRAQAYAELLPTGTLQASNGLLELGDWTLTVGATWTFDGLAGPFLRARKANFEQAIAETLASGLQEDFKLARTTAAEQARAAGLVAEAARAREGLAEESLKVGQTRLAVGLASSLEVLRLQDEAAQARADRVSAELGEAMARLEARRVAGLGWD